MKLERDRVGWRLVAAFAAALLGACSSAAPISARDAADANDTGATLLAKNEAERSLLTQVPTLPSQTARRLGQTVVVAEAPYTAASGRTCRALHLTSSSPKTDSHRLACNDGKAWFFVPDVFGGGEASHPE